MCIFCGGQCGIGDFLIAMGLPFLGLYFYRLKNALVNLKNKWLRKGPVGAELSGGSEKCSCCGELLLNCRGTSVQSIDPQKLELLAGAPPIDGPAENIKIIAKPSEPLKLSRDRELKGIGGWLLLLCLNLTVFIPASCLFETISIYNLLVSPLFQVMAIVSKNLVLYHLALIAIMGFAATFSFYAGWRLWEIKPGAVKIAKFCLLIQLFLAVATAIIRSLMVFPIAGSEHGLLVSTRIIVPSLLHFGLWYLYLIRSRRVHNTYNRGDEMKAGIEQLSVKLKVA